MKKLQNNFTTPEQSKRLLELGVPANSADCYYTNQHSLIWIKSDVDKIDFNAKVGGKNFFLPCWSVGRLIEIYHICDKPGCSFSFHVCFQNLVSEMIYKIAEAKEHGWIDFSKLEE